MQFLFPGFCQIPEVPERLRCVSQSGRQALVFQIQALDQENQRLSARLADATQTLRDLRDLAEAREQELQRLRNRLAAARARKRSEEQSTPGVTLATAGAPVQKDAVPEAPPAELPERNLFWLSLAAQSLALITVVGLLVWYMLRRQERARQSTDRLAEARPATLDGLAGAAQADPAWAMPDALSQSDQPKAEAGPDTGQEADPVAQSISEAEICLAYGQYGVAENILNKLVDGEPENAGHRLRLLHVLHAAHKHELFLEHAQALRSLVPDGDSTTWREAAELGRELFPDEPMFQSAQASEKGPPFEDTVPPAVPTQYAIPDPAQEHGRSAQPPAIDTEHLDLSFTAESSAMPAPFADEDTVPPLNVTFEEAGAEATTPEQADMDLTDELMAWDAAGSDPESSAAESPPEEHDPQPEPFTEPDTAPGMWDELTLGPGDQDDSPPGESANAPEPDEQDALRSATAGED